MLLPSVVGKLRCGNSCDSMESVKSVARMSNERHATIVDLDDVVPRVLAWQESDQILTSIQDWYFERVWDRVSLGFSAICAQDREIGSVLIDLFETLPESGALRFLAAPETHMRTSIWGISPTRHVEFFRNALVAEQIRSGNRLVTEECWSALGDYVYTANDPPPGMEQTGDTPGFSAPLIQSCIPVDFASPSCRTIRPSLKAFEPYTSIELLELCAMLNEAMAKISSVSHSAAALIRGFVRVLVVRKQANKRTSWGSSSEPPYIGRVFLRNAETVNIAAIANGLVHESIHQILSTIELSQTFVKPGAKEPQVRSPWTGRELGLRTYLHACFVWYGLARFWWMAIKGQSPFPREDAEVQLRRALSGFRQANPVDNVLDHSAIIQGQTTSVIASLRSELETNGLLD
jgi:hypothetical protein